MEGLQRIPAHWPAAELLAPRVGTEILVRAGGLVSADK